MPRKEDPSLKDENGKYKSQKYENQKIRNDEWEKKNPQEKLILRMPKGKRDIITKYVEQKARDNPDDRKYSTDKGRPSVNAYINTLIDADMKSNP